MKQAWRSQRCTTLWDDLLRVGEE
ncbi:DUF4113 domain-containing protein [Dictyobacter halimunensis]